SWMRDASRSIPHSLLRHETGSQKTRAEHANAMLAVDDIAACIRVPREATRWRQIAALDITRLTVATAVTSVRAVNAIRSATLPNSGPPGKNNAAQKTARTSPIHTRMAITRTRERAAIPLAM